MSDETLCLLIELGFTVGQAYHAAAAFPASLDLAVNYIVTHRGPLEVNAPTAKHRNLPRSH